MSLSPLWAILPLAGLVAAAGTHVLLVRRSRLRKKGPHEGTLAWTAGALISFCAFHPTPVSMAMDGSHLAYMLQFGALMSVAPPLLLLGVGPLLKRGPSPVEEGRLPRPVLAATLALWLLAAGLWHVPALHEAGAGSQALHAIRLLLFLAAGLAFWWPVVSPGRAGLFEKLAYLAVGQAGMAVLAAVLIWSPRDLYAHGEALAGGISALADQRAAGAVMALVDMTVASAVAGWLLLDAPGGRSPAAG